MTRATGSRAMGAAAPADNRSNSEPLGALTTASGIALPDGVAAELVAQRCEEALRERVGLPRAEPAEQRRGQHGQRDSPVDSLVQRPSSLAGVFHVPFDASELGVLGQRAGRELEQPRSD